VDRTGVRWDRVAIVLAVVLGLSWGAARALGGSSDVPTGQPYRVRVGDSLWDIARREVGPAEDPRPLVHAIREVNGLFTSQLVPGQVVLLPAS
jgi:Tfp pilus assembly protein FimV